MPPHCDSMDGPVVTAARRALDDGDVAIVLPYVPAAEAEVGAAFEQVLPARRVGGPAGEIADRWFFETVVRLHCAGEGAPYTGLKPVAAAREYVQAMLGLQVWAHKLYLAATGGQHHGSYRGSTR